MLEYIKQFDHLYPGIDLWWESKVMEEDHKKYWNVGSTGIVLGLVIIDLQQFKICHLSVKKPGVGIGQFLYKQGMRELIDAGATEVFAHGTPEVVAMFRQAFGEDWTPTTGLNSFGRTPHDIVIKRKIKWNEKT